MPNRQKLLEPTAAYLGDGLYVEHDGYQIRLASFNGIEILDQVFLEPTVLKAFIEWTMMQRAFHAIVRDTACLHTEGKSPAPGDKSAV